MRFHYVLLESRLERRTCYGIAAVTMNDGIEIILQSFVDLSSDRRSVAKLVRLCNKLELSLCHLPDVVEDFCVGGIDDD